jgi:outer membrane protein TolC
MNRIKTDIVLLFLLTTAVSGQQELDRYLTLAAENNAGLRATFNTYMAALQAAPQVGSMPDPTVAFGWFIQPVETREGPQQLRLSVSQMFPWFGTLGAREDAAIRSAEAKYETFLQTKSELFHEVRSLYYDLYFNRRAIAITENNLDILQSFSKLARVRIKSGSASALDEYRIDMESGDLRNQLARLRDKQTELEVAFNALLNAGEPLPVVTPDTLWTAKLGLSKAQVADSIRMNNPRIKRLERQQDALDSRKTAARKAGAPSFTLGFDYTVIGTGDMNLPGTDAFVFPRVGIRVPLYRDKYKAMVSEVEYQQMARQEEQIDTRNQLETLLEQGWNDYQDADRRLDLYRSQLDLANMSLTLLETEYSTGKQTFEEVLRMERKALQYALERERARADKHAAISFITLLMGR